MLIFCRSKSDENPERLFYFTLRELIGDKVVICPKVSLKDIFFVNTHDSKEETAWFNKIARKHLDFLLYNPGNMRPFVRCRA